MVGVIHIVEYNHFHVNIVMCFMWSTLGESVKDNVDPLYHYKLIRHKPTEFSRWTDKDALRLRRQSPSNIQEPSVISINLDFIINKVLQWYLWPSIV